MVELRSNKLEKVFEKCERLEVKMGSLPFDRLRICAVLRGSGWDCTRGSSTKMGKGKRGARYEGLGMGKTLVGGGGVPCEDALCWQVVECLVPAR